MDVKETAAKKSAKTETVEIPKEQLEQLMSGYEDMKNQIAVLTKQTVENDNFRKSTDLKRQEEERLLKIVEEENAKGEELVDVHLDMGSLRSNKNAEVSINGVQNIVPKGETVQVKRSLKEVIDNANKQKAIALDLQDRMSAEYAEAEAKGVFNA
ncbi:hypothetical protein [Ruminococcus sp.]|uniref:hypothetical protein n=1 Tax=Ruminococcus sp. TaxID=41978 RepID=UPI003F0DE1FC